MEEREGDRQRISGGCKLGGHVKNNIALGTVCLHGAKYFD